MFSRSTVVPVLFHGEHLLHFELDCDTLTLSALTKAYHRRALADHPDKGGQKEIFQETKDLYDNLMRNLEELVKIQAEKTPSHRCRRDSLLATACEERTSGGQA